MGGERVPGIPNPELGISIPGELTSLIHIPLLSYKCYKFVEDKYNTAMAVQCSVVTVSLFSRSVGVSLKKSVFGVGVFIKHYVQQMLLPTRCPGTALMLGLASKLPPHTRSLEEGEGMGSGTTDTTDTESEYGGQVPSPASNV